MPTLGLRSSQLKGVKRHRCMKLSSRDQQLGLASPLNYAAIQSAHKTQNPSKKEEDGGRAGCKPHRLPRRGGEKCFFLDILFHRMSDMEIFRQRSYWHVSNPPSFIDLPNLKS